MKASTSFTCVLSQLHNEITRQYLITFIIVINYYLFYFYFYFFANWQIAFSNQHVSKRNTLFTNTIESLGEVFGAV